ncbi:MAG: hypothetical protein AAF943_14200 [Pseudomonadota bacterium]
MSRNPIARIRLLGNTALVAVVLLALGGITLTQSSWGGWPWLIGAVSLGFAALSVAVHLRYPTKIDAAWDEQNLAAHRESLAFGYWATFAVFLIFLGAVLTGHMQPRAAFFWLAPVLAIAPSLHYLTSDARGKAE